MKRPMKGVAVLEDEFDKIRFPILGAPKIDGFRCILDRHPLTSRLSRFPNEHFHNSLMDVVPRGRILDAEVVVGRRRGPGVLSRTSSGLTSERGVPDFTLWCFDTPELGHIKSERVRMTQELVKGINHPQIRFLTHTMLESRNDLDEYLESKLELGFEGVILYSPTGTYKFGKSTLREQHMLKIKPFETAEGRIKGWFEEQENTNEAKREVTGKLKRSSAKAGKVAKGSLGGFILVDCKTGVEVRVGGGFTRSQRLGLWRVIQDDPSSLLDQLVTYKRQKVGAKDKPRHPGFVDFVTLRPEWDFTDY